MKIELNKIYCGDALEVLKQMPGEIVNCCVTSPPYWGLRDYGAEGQLGLEKTPGEYVQNLVEVFREVKRVLRKDGILWLNLGDSYASGKGTCYNPGGNTSSFNVHLKAANVHPLDRGNKKTLAVSGLKPKDLVGIPWMTAFALRADGWYLRQDIIWYKPNPMPESVTDRCTRAHEYIFLLSKSAKYYYNQDAIKEPMVEYERKRRLREKEEGLTRPPLKLSRDGKTGFTDQSQTGAVRNLEKVHALAEIGDRNKRSVWEVPTKAFSEAHYAVYPGKLIEDCIKAGCPAEGIVLDPFMGSGTTMIVSRKQEKNCIGVELSEKNIEIANRRIDKELGIWK